MTSSDRQQPANLDSRVPVTIFGGGISGLSAAHELVERGFRVYVWEPADNERDPAAGCEVGGMARSQWGAVDWPEAAKRAEDFAWEERSTRNIQHLPWVIYLSEPDEKGKVAVAAIGHTDLVRGKDAERVFEEMAQFLFPEGDAPKDKVVYCEVQRRNPSTFTALDRAKDIVDRLNDELKERRQDFSIAPPEPVDGYKELIEINVTKHRSMAKGVFRLALLDGFPEGIPVEYSERISFRLRERWLPGEHGFRFFPKFYYHLFDTMRRTPILEPVPKAELAVSQERSVTINANPQKYVETGRSAFDNLRPTANQALAFSDGGLPAVMPRRATRSLKDVRHWLTVIFGQTPQDEKAKQQGAEGGYGLSPRDVARFATKMLQYMTSCEKRREEYGRMTWLEFLGGEQAYSKNFVDLVNDSPKALVAMDARASDARTQGSIFTQLLLDNADSDGFRDGTLNGPTSVAWFGHWRRYLEAQGVEFIHGELEGFEARDSPKGGPVIWPKVSCFEPRHPGALEMNPAIAPGYFVLALPPLVAQKMARSYCDVAAELGKDVARHHPDMWRLANMFLVAQGDGPGSQETPVAITVPEPRGAMQHMVGIQYYFDQDAYGLDGHYYLPLSPWGISAISQARFWQEKADWEHGYRGVLSVGITKLATGTKDDPDLRAWDLSKAQIAAATWEQIASALSPQAPNKLPAPSYWHVDTNLTFRHNRVSGNDSPLLINLAGRWEERPGHLTKTGQLGWETGNARPADDRYSESKQYGYWVKDGIVLAGNYMKTFTRLTTMEGANESARHAVNAILRDYARQTGLATQLCDIWPLEEREVDDLDFLRELDAKLYDRNLDHFLEILDVPEIVGSTLRGSTSSVQDATDPLAILTQLDEIVGKYGRGFLSFVGEELRKK